MASKASTRNCIGCLHKDRLDGCPPRLNALFLHLCRLRFLGLIRDNARGLLQKNLRDGFAACAYDCVQQDRRDSDRQAEYRRHQRLRDTAGHRLRIAGTEQCNGLEGIDHSRDGAQKAQ